MAITLVLPGLTFAHHSTAAFENTNTALKGPIVEFDWGNPHIQVTFDVKGSDGSVVQWAAQGASVESSLADGITKNSLKPGDEVIMTVKVAKSGAPVAIIARMQKSDGTDIGFSRRGGGAAPPRSSAAAAKKPDSDTTN